MKKIKLFAQFVNEAEIDSDPNSLEIMIKDIVKNLYGANGRVNFKHFKENIMTVFLELKRKGYWTSMLPESYNRAVADDINSIVPKEWLNCPAKVGMGGATEGLIILTLTDLGKENNTTIKENMNLDESEGERSWKKDKELYVRFDKYSNVRKGKIENIKFKKSSGNTYIEINFVFADRGKPCEQFIWKEEGTDEWYDENSNIISVSEHPIKKIKRPTIPGSMYDSESTNESLDGAAIKSPFFVEATEKTIDKKLFALGIKGGKMLPPPIVGISSDGRMWEMFREDKNGKKGWMVHDSGRKIKQEFIKKYYKNEAGAYIKKFDQINEGAFGDSHYEDSERARGQAEDARIHAKYPEIMRNHLEREKAEKQDPKKHPELEWIKELEKEKAAGMIEDQDDQDTKLKKLIENIRTYLFSDPSVTKTRANTIMGLLEKIGKVKTLSRLPENNIKEVLNTIKRYGITTAELHKIIDGLSLSLKIEILR